MVKVVVRDVHCGYIGGLSMRITGDPSVLKKEVERAYILSGRGRKFVSGYLREKNYDTGEETEHFKLRILPDGVELVSERRTVVIQSHLERIASVITKGRLKLVDGWQYLVFTR